MTPGPVETGPTDVRRGTLAAILTDIHFWIPMIVLTAGTVLLLTLS